MSVFDFIPFNFIETFLSRLPGAILTILLGYLAVRILQAVFSVALRTAHVTRPMQDILLSSISTILWIGVFALLFQSLGLNQLAIALTGSVAVIGIGVATGANKLVSDVVAGLFLARNRDFKIGQHIKIAEVKGQIYSLDSRKVRILGADDTIYVIPNTKFDEQIWEVMPPEDKSGKEK